MISALKRRWSSHFSIAQGNRTMIIDPMIVSRVSAKQLGDLLIAVTWELRSVLPTTQFKVLHNFSSQSPWLLYEIGLKTDFLFFDHVSPGYVHSVVNNTIGCKRCKEAVVSLITNKCPLNTETYMSEHQCLIFWKKEMRHTNEHSIVWPRFDRSVCMIKPGLSQEKKKAIIGLLSDHVLKEKESRTLLERDIAFLYSTAYGEAFVRDMLDYYGSGEVQIINVVSNDLVAKQNQLKLDIRKHVGVDDLLVNAIHFPDSLAETYSMISYFFGQDRLIQYITNHYEQEFK